MPADTIRERDLVKQCMAELCRKAGFAEPADMVQRDLEFLCESIAATTKVQISLSTMRRLLNGQFSRMPQVATLNAMAMYLGYGHWQDFRRSKDWQKPGDVNNDPDGNRGKRFYNARFVFSGAVLVLAAVVLFAMLKFSGNRSGNFDKAEFSANKTTRNDIPNTVVFHYNVDEVNADSFFIQQSWDRNRRVRVYKNNYTLTDIYYEPGYHTAKLIANDSIIKTVDVSIPTDRWFVLAKDRKPGSIPEYIKDADLIQQGSLKVTKDDLIRNHIDITKEKEYVYTYFPSRIDVSSDNYVLKARLRMEEVRNNFCPFIMVEIFSQQYFNFFQSAPKGCSSELMAEYGEHFLGGKNVDLSALGYDVTQWVDLEVAVSNKHVMVKFGDKEVLSTTYENSSGLITGLGFISNGLCEIDFAELKGGDGRVVYSNDFDSKGNL